MSRNLIIVKREQLETELYQLEYLIKHFNMKLFPNGDGMSQFLTWLHMRKSVREKLAGLPTVKAIQRYAKRATSSNSYTKEHRVLLEKLEKLLEPDPVTAKKNSEWRKHSEFF